MRLYQYKVSGLKRIYWVIKGGWWNVTAVSREWLSFNYITKYWPQSCVNKNMIVYSWQRRWCSWCTVKKKSVCEKRKPLHLCNYLWSITELTKAQPQHSHDHGKKMPMCKHTTSLNKGKIFLTICTFLIFSLLPIFGVFSEKLVKEQLNFNSRTWEVGYLWFISEHCRHSEFQAS